MGLVAAGFSVLSCSEAWAQAKAATCVSAVIEGEVSAGNGFERVFTPGLEFMLEPMASGWMVRVLPIGEARGAHDYAELATPPYQSLTPLAISTDYSFRAQDAIGWNPRRFRYAATRAEFRAMQALYAPVMAGDKKAEGVLAAITARQPEAELRILDSRLIPGGNDQAGTAATVVSHFETTPHTVEASGASALGRVTGLKFRVVLDLPPGMRAVKGVVEEKKFCSPQPTALPQSASQLASPVRKK